jgi:hypothetical protein
MVRTISGKLMIRTRKFVPRSNIEFGVCSAGSFFGVPLESESGLSQQVHAALRYSTLGMTDFRLERLTAEDLRMLRNTVYAMHGYAFKDKDLRTFFQRFPWYVADPNLDAAALGLSREEQGLIDGVVRLEKSGK